MTLINSHSANVGLIERYLGTAYDDILWLKANIDEIKGLSIDLVAVTNALALANQAKDGAIAAKNDVETLLATLQGIAKVAVPKDTLRDIFGLEGVLGDSIVVREYYPEAGSGGGLFTYQPDLPKSLHDGGRYISPTMPNQTGHSDYLYAVGETDPTGFGIWLRSDVGVLLPEYFGAHRLLPADLPFNKCIEIAKAENISIVGFNSYTLENTVDVRDINIYLLGNIHFIHGRIGMLLGSSSVKLTNPRQKYNSFTTISPNLSLDNPTVVIYGSYNQEISIEACNGVMIKSANNYPVAHSRIALRDIGTLFLYCEGLNDNTSFIENNTVSIGTVDVLILEGQQNKISNNVFKDAYMAGAGEITLYRGINNSFENFRYNPYSTKVGMSEHTKFNRVSVNYITEQSFVVYPYLEFNDAGLGNTLYSPTRTTMTPETLVSIDINDVRLDTFVAGDRRVSPCLNAIRPIGSGIEDLLVTGFIPANLDEAFSFNTFGRTGLRYGFTVMFFDAHKRGMPPNKDYIHSLEINSVGIARMNSVRGIEKAALAMTQVAALAGVRFIRLSITSTPYSMEATGLSITRYSQDVVAPVKAPYNYGVHTLPTQGYAPQGYRIHALNGLGDATCSFSMRTHLVGSVSLESLVGNVVGIEKVRVGDICGISLDNRKTHWSKVVAKVATGIRLEEGVPFFASEHNEVVFVRWVTR